MKFIAAFVLLALTLVSAGFAADSCEYVATYLDSMAILAEPGQGRSYVYSSRDGAFLYGGSKTIVDDGDKGFYWGDQRLWDDWLLVVDGEALDRSDAYVECDPNRIAFHWYDGCVLEIAPLGLERLDLAITFSSLKPLTESVFYLIWPAKYYNFQWPIRRDDHNSSGKTSENSGGNGYFELDEVDKQILEILTENALNKPPEMSARLDVSEGKIRKHLKKMSDHGLFKMDVLYTPGRDVSATIGIALHRCSVSNVMEYIVTQFPRVLMATFCIGRFNIILTASFRDNDALNEFVNVNLKSIKGITSIETFIHTKRIKYHVS